MELPACLPLRITYYLPMDMDARKQPGAEPVSFFSHNTLPCLAVDAALGLGPFCLWMARLPRLSFVSLLFPCCFCVLSRTASIVVRRDTMIRIFIWDLRADWS
jgi:hypothetical protein